jgi:EmrB/QacA subfamily drug resistance transporter
MIAVCLGLGMLMIDNFVVNVALPTISRTLHADLDLAEWTVSGYVLVLGVFPIAMGRLGDQFGRRRVFLAGLVVFVAASAACGAAPNIELLVTFRVLQGLGAAVMMPGTLSIVTQAFPPEERGLAIGIWGGVSGLGLIAGPILGGLLVHGDSWRWIFYVNVPIGLAALVMTLRFVPESRDEKAARSIDWAGLALLSVSLTLIMFGFTRANRDGWTAPLILGCFVVGVAALAAFLLVERRVRAPLVDLGLFRSGPFVMACLSAFLFSAAVFGAQPYMSLFMQNYWGFSALKGGLAFIPSTALVAMLMPLSGIMGQRLGSRLRLLIIAGSLSVVLSALALVQLNTGSGYGDGLLPSFLLRGAGIGLVMSATSLAVVSAVPLAKSGLASGTLTMSRNIGTAMGVAIFGAVFMHHIDTTLPARLDAAPARVQQIRSAADHFVPTGDGRARLVAGEVIVDGFVRIAIATSLVTAVAAGAAVFIRHRPAGARGGEAASQATGPRPLAADSTVPLVLE